MVWRGWTLPGGGIFVIEDWSEGCGGRWTGSSGTDRPWTGDRRRTADLSLGPRRHRLTASVRGRVVRPTINAFAPRARRFFQRALIGDVVFTALDTAQPHLTVHVHMSKTLASVALNHLLRGLEVLDPHREIQDPADLVCLLKVVPACSHDEHCR